MKETMIKISADGTETLCLYHDNNPFEEVATTKKIARASNVKFNNKDGLWYVHDPAGDRLLSTTGFDRRGDAIQHEIDILEGYLVDASMPEPDFV